jgi:cyclopropane-fatty-acyl-phospholipid synthase
LSISKNQLAWSKKRDGECLLPAQARRIEYRLEDYVDHERTNHYDAISVIGMIEHVGLGGYPELFSTIHRLLKPGAKALIHTIVSPLASVPSNRWIEKHIFSGGYAPSISELTREQRRRGLPNCRPVCV